MELGYLHRSVCAKLTRDTNHEPDHGTMSYLPLIAGIDYGEVCYDLDARALTPAESVEKVQQLWQTFLDTANGVESVAQ